LLSTLRLDIAIFGPLFTKYFSLLAATPRSKRCDAQELIWFVREVCDLELIAGLVEVGVSATIWHDSSVLLRDSTTDWSSARIALITQQDRAMREPCR
jgi:hypothetical protein